MVEKFNLGLIANSIRPSAVNGIVYGYDVATNELIDNILLHSESDNLIYICEHNSFHEYIFSKKCKRIYRKKQSCVYKINELDLLLKDNAITTYPHILHNVDSQFTQMICLRESFNKKIPITFTIHCASYPEDIEKFFLKMLLYPLKSYDTLICTSYSVKKVVENILSYLEITTNKTFKASLEVIPLGVDTTFFAPRPKQQFRDNFGLSNEEFVILWLGRFDLYQKADLFPLLLVFSRLLEKNPNKRLRLVLAGSQLQGKNYLKELERYCCILDIMNYVTFLVNPTTSDRYQLYNACDVFTSPVDNIQETFGITPIEAMSSGVPQVVSDWDGYRDTVIDNETGFLIPTYWVKCDEKIENLGHFPYGTDNRRELYGMMMSQSVVIDLIKYEGAFQALLDDSELRLRMAEASRRRAIEVYDWKVVMAQYNDLWKSKIDESKKFDSSVRENRADSNLFTPRYCDSFQHYATSIIDESTLFSSTNSFDDTEIKQILKNSHIIDQLLAMNIIEYIKSKDKVMFADLIIHFSTYGCSVDVLKITIMNLWKYGIIK